MVFSSITFLYFFLPVFFLGYYLMPLHVKNSWLLLGSLIFYYYGVKDNPFFLLILIASIVVNYFVGIQIERCKTITGRKIWLIIGLVYDFSWLLLFKYSNFLIENVNGVFHWLKVDVTFDSLQVILPIGISFYTFQITAYLMDVYRKNVEAERSIISLGVYLCMFPQLIAGPIVNYKQVQSQLKRRTHTLFKIDEGLKTFAIGLGLKVLLANQIGRLWNNVNAIGYESISTPLAWLGIIAFSFQIYFDFYGYSLMAIGLGKRMGFQLPDNFHHPYTAVSMTEFWRKWHITLGAWFREYIYIPLGGNRCGKLKTMRNIFVVWLLTGIWHGASWNFVVWGLVLFFILMIEKIALIQYLERYRILGHLYMIILIPVTWTIFAITDFSQLKLYFMKLFPFFGVGQGIYPGDYLKYGKMYGIFLLLGVLFSTKLPFNVYQKYKNSWVMVVLLLLAFWMSVYGLYMGMDDPFLYFQF